MSDGLRVSVPLGVVLELGVGRKLHEVVPYLWAVAGAKPRNSNVSRLSRLSGREIEMDWVDEEEADIRHIVAKWL